MNAHLELLLLLLLLWRQLGFDLFVLGFKDASKQQQCRILRWIRLMPFFASMNASWWK